MKSRNARFAPSRSLCRTLDPGYASGAAHERARARRLVRREICNNLDYSGADMSSPTVPDVSALNRAARAAIVVPAAFPLADNVIGRVPV